MLDSAPKNQKSAAALAATRNWALLALNHADEAGADAENALKTQRVPELVLQRGIAKFLKKDFVGARTDAQEILRTNAADSGALSLAIQACLADKQNALALQILKESTAKNSASPRMQLVAGEWLRQLGKTTDARAAFIAAKTLNPRFTDADLAWPRSMRKKAR